MAPRLARGNAACRTDVACNVACNHGSGLFTQSGWTAGPDGGHEPKPHRPTMPSRVVTLSQAQSQNSVSGECDPDSRNGSHPYPACVVLTTLGETDLANSRRYPDGTQQQHVERATRWTCAGTCIGQRPNYSVCALLGAEAGAPFSSPAPSFADSRRRYPRVGCRLDRMERMVLVHRKLGRGFALPILEFPAMGPAMAADRYASGSP